MSERGCGCIALVAIFGVASLISQCNDKHSSAPKIRQPSTGYVAPASSQSDERNSAPRVSQPFGKLQSGGVIGGEAALRMTNNMSTPAYVKVYEGHGSLFATIYLRSQESYELSINPGTYRIKYVTGPADEWRGTSHYFGSRSSFYSDKGSNYIASNQILSLTFYTQYTRGGSRGNLNKIDEDEF